MSDGGEDTALADVTNTMGKTQINPNNAAAIGRVKDARWSAPEKFNYEAYNADSKEKRQAVEAVQDVPAWAANAVKYEWSEEFGDVGPEYKELEEVLFGDDNQMKAGDAFST